jgi:hypothetical protein
MLDSFQKLQILKIKLNTKLEIGPDKFLTYSNKSK